jgi:hypothetical protein
VAGLTSVASASLLSASPEADRDTAAEPGREINELKRAAIGPNSKVISRSADIIESDPCTALCVASVPNKARILDLRSPNYLDGAVSLAFSELVGPAKSRQSKTAFNFSKTKA